MHVSVVRLSPKCPLRSLELAVRPPCNISKALPAPAVRGRSFETADLGPQDFSRLFDLVRRGRLSASERSEFRGTAVRAL